MVGAAGFKERAVTTVVEDNEDPDEETAPKNSQGESEQIGELHREIHRGPECEIEADGVDDLPSGFCDRGLGVRGDDLFPFFDGRQVGGIAHESESAHMRAGGLFQLSGK